MLIYKYSINYRRAARIIQSGFEDYACVKQDFLADDSRINKLLSLVPAEYKFFFTSLLNYGYIFNS